MGLTHLSRLNVTPTAGKGDAATDHALEINSSRLSTGRAIKITKGTTEKWWVGSGGQMQVGGTLVCSGVLQVRRSITYYGTVVHSGALETFRNPVLLEGTLTASGAKNTFRNPVVLEGTLTASGAKNTFRKINLFEGTITASGASNTIRHTTTFNGTANFTSGVVYFQRWAQLSVFTGGGSAIAGRAAIGASGIATVATKRIAADSVLLLTPSVNTGLANAIAYENRGVRSAGTSFQVNLRQSGGTAITGAINWLIVQTTS